MAQLGQVEGNVKEVIYAHGTAPRVARCFRGDRYYGDGAAARCLGIKASPKLKGCRA